jgi:hypothetical protein
VDLEIDLLCVPLTIYKVRRSEIMARYFDGDMFPLALRCTSVTSIRLGKVRFSISLHFPLVSMLCNNPRHHMLHEVCRVLNSRSSLIIEHSSNLAAFSQISDLDNVVYNTPKLYRLSDRYQRLHSLSHCRPTPLNWLQSPRRYHSHTQERRIHKKPLRREIRRGQNRDRSTTQHLGQGCLRRGRER